MPLGHPLMNHFREFFIGKVKKVNDYNLGTVFFYIPDIYLPFLSIFEYKIYPNPSLAEYHLSQGLGKNIKIACGKAQNLLN